MAQFVLVALTPFLLAAALTVATPVVSGPDPLAGLRWKARALVVFAPDDADPRLAAQRRLYHAARDGNGERDLVLIEAVGGSPEAEMLRRRFKVEAGAFRALLIGKDGGPKLAESEPIPSQRLFDTIDAMPMRQDERRQRP